MLQKIGDRKTIGSKAFDLYRCGLIGALVPNFVVVPIEFHEMDNEKEAITILREELRKALTELGGVVAVRSSSVAEDLNDSSNAGQFKTVLGVDNRQALEEAIFAVWRSSRGHPMAVIIQRMLAPDISGVLFTRNPVSGTTETIIEYVDGLAESFVSGKRDPRRLEISNETEIETNHPFTKLIEMSKKLEDGFGYPLDIEWARCGGDLYILQARPITNLPPPDATSGPSYSRVHAEEFFSGPVTPLFHSIFSRLYADYYIGEALETLGVKIPVGYPILVRHKNYLFADTRLTEYTFTRMPLASGKKRLLEVLPPDIREKLLIKKGMTNPSGIVRLLKFLFMNPKFWRSKLDVHFKEEVVPEIIRRLDALGDFRKMDPQGLIDAYRELIDISHLHIDVSKWGLVLYSMPLSDRMGFFLENNGIERESLPLLMVGLEDNKTLDANNELKSLAELILENPQAKEVVQNGHSDYFTYRRALEHVPKGDLIIEYFESILTRYGHRRLSRDFISPSWTNDPMIPFGIIRDLVCEKDAKPAAARQQRKDRRCAVRQDIERRLPMIKRRYFRTLSRYLSRYTAFREFQRFYLDMIISRLRDLIFEISKRMQGSGVIKRTDDIFFLEMQDASEFLSGRYNPELQNKALLNRLTYKDQEGTPGRYMRLGVDFDSIDKQEDVQISGHTIKGKCISPGTYSGRAYVIPDINRDVKIERGDVVVTRCLDPGQTHFLMMAGALILEVGGMLSHGAILARELGIPTVAQVRNATVLLKNGQQVLVDGSHGTIVIEA